MLASQTFPYEHASALCSPPSSNGGTLSVAEHAACCATRPLGCTAHSPSTKSLGLGCMQLRSRRAEWFRWESKQNSCYSARLSSLEESQSNRVLLPSQCHMVPGSDMQRATGVPKRDLPKVYATPVDPSLSLLWPSPLEDKPTKLMTRLGTQDERSAALGNDYKGR